MTPACTAPAESAKSVGAKSCTRSGTSVPSIDPVMRKARSCFPVKTAAHLSEITGYSERAVKYWLAGETKIPSDALAALIRSEHGLQFLSVLMSGASPTWWTWLQRLGLVSRVLRRRQADLQILREAMDADKELSATLARADALLVHEADPMGACGDALVETVSSSNRPLASGVR